MLVDIKELWLKCHNSYYALASRGRDVRDKKPPAMRAEDGAYRRGNHSL
jgi:hypothetical protein